VIVPFKLASAADVEARRSFVLWGARGGDVQVGSWQDQALQRRLRIMAALRREIRRSHVSVLTPRVTSGYRVGDAIVFDFAGAPAPSRTLSAVQPPEEGVDTT